MGCCLSKKLRRKSEFLATRSLYSPEEIQKISKTLSRTGPGPVARREDIEKRWGTGGEALGGLVLDSLVTNRSNSEIEVEKAVLTLGVFRQDEEMGRIKCREALTRSLRPL